MTGNSLHQNYILIYILGLVNTNYIYILIFSCKSSCFALGSSCDAHSPKMVLSLHEIIFNQKGTRPPGAH